MYLFIGLFESNSIYNKNLVTSQLGDLDHYVDAVDTSIWGTTENFIGMARDNEDTAILYEQYISPQLPYYYFTQIYRFDRIITSFDRAILYIDFLTYTPTGLDVYVGPSRTSFFRIGQLRNPGLISFDISSLLLSTPFFLKLTDGDNPSNLGPYRIRRMYIHLINARNSYPVVNAGADQSTDEGDIVSFSGSFTDSDVGDTHNIHWSFGDGSEAIGTLTPTHIYTDNGVYTVTLTVSDNHGAMDSDSLMVSVNNLAPSAEAGEDQVGNEGELINFEGSFSDPGISDTHFVEWDFGDGIISSGTLTPSHSYGDNGVYEVTMTVTDDDGGSDSDTLTVIINNLPPTVIASEDQYVVEGIETTIFLATFTDPGFYDTHTAIVDWGDGTSGPADLKEFQSESEGEVTGTHIYSFRGVYTAIITLTDDDGGVDTDNLFIYVENQAPIVDAGPDQAVDEGELISFSGSFSDYGSGDSFLIEWDFGDGNTATGTLSPTHSYGDDGIYIVTLIITDGDGGIGTDTTTIIVNNIAPTVDAGEDQSVYEGDTVYFHATFNDPGSLDLHTVEWDFGDGTVDSGTLTPVHSYLDDGIYTVTVTITDDEGGVGTDSLTITVLNLAPVVNAGEDQTGNEGDIISFSGSFTDQGLADSHTINWDFGDGTYASGSLNPTHTYQDNGDYIVILTITDDDGGSSTDSLQVMISNVAPNVDIGNDQIINEGDIINFQASFIDPGVLDTHTIEWNFGDGHFESGTLNPQHSYLDDGIYAVTLTITDSDGDIGSDSITVTVLNLAPVVNAGVDQTGNEGDIISFSGSFTDLGILDTHSIEWDFGDGNTATGTLTPTHSYGDDGIYEVILTVTDDDGGVDSDTLAITLGNLAPVVDAGPDMVLNMGDLFEFNGYFTDPGYLDTHTIEWDFGDDTIELGVLNPTHSYEVEGNYTVVLTITDDDGAIGTDSLNVEVIRRNNPKELKLEAIDLLEELKSGDNCEDRTINLVIMIISESLCDKFWINDTHLNPKYGFTVFFLELVAIKIINEYLDVDATQGVIDKLIEADLLLATTALEEAESLEVKVPEFQDIYDCYIHKANYFMEKATDSLQEGKYECTIFYFMLSWMYAQRAIMWANKEFCCPCSYSR